MSTIIRIKRQLNEEPLNALVLNCKKRKFSDGTEDNLSTFLKFAGTVQSSDEDVLKHVQKPSKSDIEGQYKKHLVNVSQKLRDETQLASKNDRYRVVNSFRSNLSKDTESSNSKLEQTDDKQDVTIVDVITNEEKPADDSEKQYVYDLYYTSSDDFGDEADFNELMSIYPLSDNVIYDNYRDNEGETYLSDDSDSNAENNWRNEYPDESDVGSFGEDLDNSVTEDDMLAAMNRVKLGPESDLSSDYSEDSPYNRDEDTYGERYRNFLRSMKSEDEEDDSE